MHIGIDALLLHGVFSGVEQAIYRLLCELWQEGGAYEYSIYVSCDFPHGELTRPAFTLRRQSFYGANRWRRILWTHFAFHRQALADGVQLLHGPGYLLPPRWRGPSVATVYDIIALTHPHLCATHNALYYRWRLPQTLTQATAIIVPSQFVKDTIRERLKIPAEKLHVIPLGVGAEFNAPLSEVLIRSVRGQYGIHDPYVLCVGNIEPKKNLVATIRAFALAKRVAGLPHRLVLAGGKAWKSQAVEQAVHTHGPEVVVHLGYVEPSDLPALDAAADTLLFWSLVEGCGLPALEALACGTPVICSDRGALPEVVGDAALVVPIGPPERLAEAICALLTESKQRALMAERGRQRAAEFTWRKYAEAVLRVYAEVGGDIQ
ncbi:MAG: glycosyltransferase family 4 protein [Candidatus Zipacnadales bacterium]